MTDTRLVQTDQEIQATYELMAQLHERVRTLDRADYVLLVRQQQKEVGYHLVYQLEDQEPICVAGFRLCRSIGWGKYLYVDDLVTDKERRSTGAGKTMFDWLCEWGRAEGCEEIRLDCRTDRLGAHRFYFRQRMDIRAFHFVLKL